MIDLRPVRYGSTIRGGIALCMSVPGSTALGSWLTWSTPVPCAVTCCASVHCATTYLGFHGTRIIADCVPGCLGAAPGRLPKITARRDFCPTRNCPAQVPATDRAGAGAWGSARPWRYSEADD